MLRCFILTTIFITPILATYNTFGYEHIKVLWFIVITFIAGLTWLIGYHKQSSGDFRWTKIKLLSTIFIFLLLMTSLLGLEVERSIFGQPPYFQGWLLYSFLLLFSWLVSSTKTKIEWVSYVLVGSSIVVAVLALKDWMLINVLREVVPTYAGRVVSTFGQPNLYSGFILLTLPFYYYLAKQHQRWAVWVYLAGGLAVASIIISFSRAAILLGMALLGIWFFTLFKRTSERVFFGFLVVLLIILASFYMDISGKVSKELGLGNYAKPGWFNTYSPERRVYIWPIILNLVTERALLGYGLDNLSLVFSSKIRLEEAKTLQAADLKNLVVDRSHNYVLDLLVFSGILGLVSWVLLVLTTLKKANSKILFISLLLYVVWIQLQIQSVVHLIYFWTLVGLVDQERAH